MQKKELAVIIPYVNLAEYILALLDTVCPKVENQIFLIDNNSNSETKEKLEKVKHKEGITVLQNERNVGVGCAWNQGIEKAIKDHDVDYITILNNDILLAEDCIKNMIGTIKKYQIPLVSGYDVAKECAMPEDVIFMKPEKKEVIRDEPQFSCFTIDVDFFQKMKSNENKDEKYPGRFDGDFYPAYFEDNDMHYRLKLLGQRAVSTNQALYFHYGSRTIRENEELDNNVRNTYLKNQKRFIKKWGGEPLKERYKTPFNIINR